MTRLFSAGILLAAALLASGCPLYAEDCSRERDCAVGWTCHEPTGECRPEAPDKPPTDVPTRCRSTEDCELGQVCDEFLRCVEPAGAGGAAGNGAEGGSPPSSGGGAPGGSGGEAGTG